MKGGIDMSYGYGHPPEDVINITMKLCQRVYYVDIPLRYFLLLKL